MSKGKRRAKREQEKRDHTMHDMSMNGGLSKYQRKKMGQKVSR